jgi:hypothetical protein
MLYHKTGDGNRTPPKCSSLSPPLANAPVGSSTCGGIYYSCRWKKVDIEVIPLWLLAGFLCDNKQVSLYQIPKGDFHA